jgi:hypothetical protein
MLNDMHFRINARTMCVAPPFDQDLSHAISEVINIASAELGLAVIQCEPPFSIGGAFISTRNIDFVFHNNNDSMTVVVPTFDEDGNHFMDALVCLIGDPIGNGLMIPAPSYGLPHGEA